MSITTSKYSTQSELEDRQKLIKSFKECPIPPHEMLRNLGLFINRVGLMRLLFMSEMYHKIINTHGVVMEFGCRWGQNLSFFINLRGTLDPYNLTRKIIGFDTFDGLKGIDDKDRVTEQAQLHANQKDYGVTENYDLYLKEILDYHARECPVSQVIRHEIIKGDVSETIKTYLKNHPETIIAFAYFDMDIYKPTKECLEAIKPHLAKGSIIGFDELNCEDFPGETLALKEVLGVNNYKIVNSKYGAGGAYLIFE